MQLINVEQGSDKWLDLRLEHLCASEAPAMMGASPYLSRNQLLDLKKGWAANPHGDFKEALFQKAHKHEASAREFTEVDLVTSLSPAVGMNVVDGLGLLASFDGISEDVDLVWEHKDWNPILAENANNGVLEPLHYWQLEHQCLVSDVDHVYFTVSDGTMTKRVTMVYRSVKDRRDELIAGWKQFVIDLDKHEIEAKQEVIPAQEAEAFPSINYRVEGSLIISNIDECLPLIKERAEKEMSRELESDKDFAEKDQLNKATKKAREKLKEIVRNVEKEFVSYSEFAQVAADIDSVLQKMQSHGERQVKDQKEDRKKSMRDAAISAFHTFEQEIDEKIYPTTIAFIMGDDYPSPNDLVAIQKGKRSLEKMRDGIDQWLADIKIKVNDIIDRVMPNLDYYNSHAKEHDFLFRDIAELLDQPKEAFEAVVKTRIGDYDESQKQKEKKTDNIETPAPPQNTYEMNQPLPFEKYSTEKSNPTMAIVITAPIKNIDALQNTLEALRNEGLILDWDVQRNPAVNES